MIVIKAGGGSALNWEGLIRDLVDLAGREQAVLIHGAHDLRDRLAARLGVPLRAYTSPSGIESVYTDAAAMEVFCQAYPGAANTRITALLQAAGLNAIGLSGVDGGLWRAKAKKDLLVREDGRTLLLRGNLTGRVDGVNTALLKLLLDNGYLPVLCAPALSAEGEAVNTDNDAAAAATASALGAKRLIFLLDADGLLADPDRPDSRIPFLPVSELDRGLACARGRMRRKIMAVRQAWQGGVPEIVLGDGRREHPLRDALAGRGTIIREAEASEACA